MNKIFLSHSSNDKEYVSYIANQFGKDQCVYDELCFEAGMKNLDEIFKEMNKTSIFVFFISETSLESKWVKKELSIADERLNHDPQKLSQIFPIIIDPLIHHNDPRIPNFIKNGFSSYNLRVITSKTVAYRKIKAQQMRHLLEMSPNSRLDDCFYGRDEEIANFKKKFDSGEGIKCLVASGFTGIGRKSYLVQCLKRSQIIEEYYMPPTISMNTLDSIEDLIVKLSEIGFGEHSLEDITMLPDIDRKIELLTSVFRCIQDYKEQVIIYDNGCLISQHGEILYWFQQALDNIRNEVTLIIAAKHNLNMQYLKKNKSIFSQFLSTLPFSEWLGLMRVYGNECQVSLTPDDRMYFRDILTGYPPQVKYCIDLMKETSVEEVKAEPTQVIEAFSPKVTEMLNSSVPKDLQGDAFGLLAFLSMYGIVPGDLLRTVLSIKPAYKQAFSLFKTLTICRYLGIANEYIEVNPLISDYVQRNRFNLPHDIQNVLHKRLFEFNQNVENGKSVLSEDFENLKYYLKSNIMTGKEIPVRFMYSTLYLTSIYDLYNHQKYNQVIELMKKLKETGAFDRYDTPVQIRMQGFYCRALAREVQPKFYEEVEFFNRTEDTKDVNEYDFLRGFMFRHNSEYDKALERYKRVLERQPKHRSAMREIVSVYRGLEDYESAYEYAKANYLRDSENLYQIQPYFEILIRKPRRERSDNENNYIKEMIQTVERINSTNPSTAYYEILGQYAAYEEKDFQRMSGLLTEGLQKFPESSYIVRALFDCSEVFADMDGMKTSLMNLKDLAKENKSVKVAYHIRQALYFAYCKKPRDFIYNTINAINGINRDTKERLKKKIDRILDQKNN